MRDLALQAAGVLAIVVAVIHGAIAEMFIFAKARIEPEHTRTLLRLIWQASTIDWIAIGVLLIAAPMFALEVRRWIVAVAVVVYTYAALGNAIASGGRHIGWMLMACVVALALAGL
jgi:hypothetical protein